MKGLFVTGTDTGVGKTVAACGIVRALRGTGLDLGVMKPIETGVGPEGPLDAMALRSAAGGVDPLDEVCPLRFALPAAPNVAAAAEGKRVDLAAVDSAFTALAARHDALLVEGAGGLLVPTTDSETMASLAMRMGLPVVLVARAALGTINHTRLTLAEAERRGVEIAGVVVCHTDGPLSDADAQNLDFLLDELGERLLAEIPPLASPERASEYFDAERLVAALNST